MHNIYACEMLIYNDYTLIQSYADVLTVGCTAGALGKVAAALALKHGIKDPNQLLKDLPDDKPYNEQKIGEHACACIAMGTANS